MAALSELPRAQVTAKRGGEAFSRRTRSRQMAELAEIRRATTSGASAVSRAMRLDISSAWPVLIAV